MVWYPHLLKNFPQFVVIQQSMRWVWGSFKELGGCLLPKQEPRERWQKPVCGAEAHLPPAAPQPSAPHVSLTPAAPK